MKINVVLKYIHGGFSVIELSRGSDKKVIVYDCGSYSCNWGYENFKDPSTIVLNSHKYLYAKFWNNERELPLSNCGFDEYKDNKLCLDFKELNELQPDVIIVSHPDRDHYNCLPLLNFEHLNKIICHKEEFFVDSIKDRADIIELSGVETHCLKDLLDDSIYEVIDIHIVEGTTSNNDVGLICVVHGESKSIFMPGDASPISWTDEVIDDVNKCEYIVLPHHGSGNITNRADDSRLLSVHEKNITFIANDGVELKDSQKGFIRQISGHADISSDFDDEGYNIVYLEKLEDDYKYLPWQIEL